MQKSKNELCNKVFIVGLGSLGGHALEFLARTPGIRSIVAADCDEDWGLRKLNNAQLGAASQGYYPEMGFRKVDLNNIEETAGILKEEDPSVVYNATTIQSWWVIGELPKEHYEKLLQAGLGPWTPMHLTLTHKLMKAVKKAGISGHVLSSSFPDVVNPILSKVGLAPLVGIGNLDLLVPFVKRYVSHQLKVPMRNVTVFMLAHHYHDVRVEEFGSTMGAPYYLKIMVGDRNVTGRIDLDEMWAAFPPVPPGKESDQRVAGSAVKNIAAIINDTDEITHSPGPKGLPGGYPVRLNADGAEVVLPEELTLQDAIKINEEAQKFDGVERIEDDGALVYTDKSVEIMKEMLGYDCRRLRIEDGESRANELRSLYRKFASSLKQSS
jgi:hypothetical protein